MSKFFDVFSQTWVSNDFGMKKWLRVHNPICPLQEPQPEIDDGTWIKYIGKGQPVADDIIINIKFSSGAETKLGWPSSMIQWDSIDPAHGYVTAYQIV